jgi:tripartite-type tricarboxylate transporter receptor subunit TctC
LSPGGGFDITARLIAAEIGKFLPNNFPVVVLNRPGGNWNVGLGELYRAKPDGHTLSVFNLPANVMNEIDKSATYKTEEFEWVYIATSNPLVGVVKKGAPYTSLKDFVNATGIKASTVGLTSGTGLSTVLQFETLGIKNGIIVPHAGASDALTSVLRGDVDYFTAGIAASKDMIANGDLVPIVAFSDQRLKQFPNVPTAAEQGFAELTLMSNPYGVVGLPPNTPKEIVDIWIKAFKDLYADPGFRAKFEAAGLSYAVGGVKEIEGLVQYGLKNLGYLLETTKKYE